MVIFYLYLNETTILEGFHQSAYAKNTIDATKIIGQGSVDQGLERRFCFGFICLHKEAFATIVQTKVELLTKSLKILTHHFAN